MKLANKITSKIKNQQGAVSIIVGLALFFFIIGFAALAIDVGYLYATRNELQNIADSAALAAAGELGDQYHEGGGITLGLIKDVAVDAGSKNRAADKFSIIIVRDDIEIGNWKSDADPPSFDPYDPSVGLTGKEDAIRVRARRDPGSGNNSVGMFFAQIFGFATVALQADATAALSGPTHVVAGGLPIPVGIGKVRFASDFCDEPILFYPSNDLEACGGWHVYEDDKDHLKQDIIQQMMPGVNPPYQSPYTEGGMDFYFKGGTDNAAWTMLKTIFDDRKVINDYFVKDAGGAYTDEITEWPIDGDMDPNVWTATVVVYDQDDCSNPNEYLTIIGFAAIRIYEVCIATSDPTELITGGGVPWPDSDPPLPALPPPPNDYCISGEKKLVANIACNYTKASRGGGGEYGIMGIIPGLVE